MKRFLTKASLVAITAMSMSAAYADPADLSNMTNFGAGAVVNGGTAPTSIGGDASVNVTTGFYSASGSIGAVTRNHGSQVIGSGSFAVPVSSNDGDPGDPSSTGSALMFKTAVNTDGNTLRVTPLALGQSFISRNGKTKVGIYASPWNYEYDINNGLSGNSASLSAQFQTNIGNIVLLHGAAEAGLLYGMHRKFLTNTQSTESQACDPNNPANCTDTYKEVTSQTSPGYRQSGIGNYERLEAGLTVRLGEHLIGDASAYAERRSAPLQKVDYIAGPGAPASLGSTNVGVRVGVATAF